MPKLTLNDLANLENEQTAINTINANNALIEAAIENTLSRDGTTPNTMSAPLDMNSQRITNLPAASASSEPVRKQEFDDAIGDIADIDVPAIQGYATSASSSATAAAASAAAADASATEAEYWASQAEAISGGAVAANLVTFTPVGTISATDVQAALNELQGETTTSLNLKAPLASPTFTGTPAAPTATAGTNTTQIATTAFVTGALGSYLTAAVAASTYAPLASPALTGNPTAPTPTTTDNDTSIATTAFVKAQGYVTSSSLSSYALDSVVVKGVRLGSAVTSTHTNDAGVTVGNTTAGYVLRYATWSGTHLSLSTSSPIQHLINGSWATVSG